MLNWREKSWTQVILLLMQQVWKMVFWHGDGEGEIEWESPLGKQGAFIKPERWGRRTAGKANRCHFRVVAAS